MRFGILLSAFAAVSVTACATSGTQPTQREAAELRAEDSDDPVICRSERPIGSRLSERVCHPRSVWAEMRRDAERVRQNADAVGQTVDVFEGPAGPGGR